MKKIKLTRLDKIFIKLFLSVLNIVILMALGAWIADIASILIPFVVLLCAYTNFKIWEDGVKFITDVFEGKRNI